MISTLKKPIVTEKNSLLAEHGVYVFKVDRQATKVDIKKAVEKMFRVKVQGVRTANCRGRSKNSKLGTSKVAYWKKALVSLAPGNKISLFEGA